MLLVFRIKGTLALRIKSCENSCSGASNFMSPHWSAFMQLPILVRPGKAHINDGKRNDSFKGGALIAS